MYKVEKKLGVNSKSHCKVGKITYRKNATVDTGSISFDYKTEASKKSK
ncbi:hypothetical protein [Flavobacterium aquariorum]|nr:hypothetical protein [Flavobacterium aquariorum]